MQQMIRSENVDFPQIVPLFENPPEAATLVRCDYAGTCDRAGYIFQPEEYFRFVDLCTKMKQEQAFFQALYPPLPPVENLEAVFDGEVIAPLKTPSPRELPFEDEAFDWWNQEEEEWPCDHENGEFPEDAFDHLTEEEFEDYLFDRLAMGI